MSDVQWFREAYGAVTQTVRVVASEQSRQQRGWVFTPGEPVTTFAPKLAPPPVDQAACFLVLGHLLSPWQAVGECVRG